MNEKKKKNSAQSRAALREEKRGNEVLFFATQGGGGGGWRVTVCVCVSHGYDVSCNEKGGDALAFNPLYATSRTSSSLSFLSPRRGYNQIIHRERERGPGVTIDEKNLFSLFPFALTQSRDVDIFPPPLSPFFLFFL